MDKEAVLKIIRRFGEALGNHGVRASKIILYGSYARGDWREWSDIDLVVMSDDFADKSHWEPIEAVAMTPEEWEKGDSMIAQFAREGEEVYSA